MPKTPRRRAPKNVKTLQDLTLDPNNARGHTPRNLDMIAAAIGEVGAARSIVIDEAGVVLAGNGTVEGAERNGIERVLVVDADGKTLVAVRRTGLTDEQKQRLSLFDNRAGELAYWLDDRIATLAESNRAALDGLFFDPELNEFIRRAAAIPATVDFREFDERNADKVEFHECPNCGHKWPK